MNSHDQAAEPRIPVEQALRTLVELRRDDHVVITNQSSARLWPRLSDHPLDFNYNPSNMGGAVPLAVGLALTQPAREIIVLSGDGSLLMNLGCLVTAIASGVTNLTIILLDNGMYEVTGGQKTPATGNDIDFPSLARAAGFPNVSQFWDHNDWQTRAPRVLESRGPRFICLAVGPTPRDVFRDQHAPIVDRLARLRAALV